jgi:tetratricopeptide (TPR) repeat protein
MGWKIAAMVVLLVLCLGTSAGWGQTGTVEEAERLNKQLIQLYRQGNYAEAVRLGERALAIWEKVRGPEHPDTATGLNNLALLYRTMGQMAQALPLYQRALAIREKVRGPEHPDTATALYNLAELYQKGAGARAPRHRPVPQ